MAKQPGFPAGPLEASLTSPQPVHMTALLRYDTAAAKLIDRPRVMPDAAVLMKAKARIVPLYENKHYGPDHHIWNNNGTWWVHFSVTRRRGRSKRIRLSLRTSSKTEARKRRDQILRCRVESIESVSGRWT